MDIYTYLHKDHLKVSKLFKEITASTEQKEREQLFLEVKKELELHADPERDTFYKALQKKAKGKEDAEHGNEEHDEIKKALKIIDRIDTSEHEEEWLINVGKLMHIVEHHVEDEETTMFEDGKKIISEKQALSLVDEIKSLKEKLRSSKKFIEAYGELP